MEPSHILNPVVASKYRLSNIGVIPKKASQPSKDSRIQKLCTNHYQIVSQIKNIDQIYLYSLKVQPEISLDNRQLRRQIIDQTTPEIEQTLGKFYLSGHVLFASNCNEAVNVFQTKVGKTQYTIDLNVIRDRKDKKNTLPRPKCLKLGTPEENIQFQNSILKKMMLQLGYKDIGILSKYFDVSNPCQVKESTLQVYRGFYSSIDIYQSQQPMVLIDVSTRVLQSQSCLTFMNTIKNKNQLEDSVIGNSVIVQYGNYRTYHIDDIMFKMTPNSTFMKNGKQITYKAYYKSAYNITIKDNSQPLLLSIRKQKDSDGKVVEFNCYLVPELCKMTGMTDKEKNNWKIMQNVAQFTKMFPNQRMEEQQQLVNKLNQLMQDKTCPIKIGQQTPVTATVLRNPQIQMRSSVKPNNGDFKNGMRSPVLEPVQIPKYMLVYYNQDYNDAELLAQNLKSCAGAYGIRVGDVEYSEMEDTNEKSWANYIQEDYKSFNKQNSQLYIVVVLLPFKNGDNIYNAVKDVCCNKLNILSQCVKPKTLQKNTKSVVSNLLLQMNAKMNGSSTKGTLWTVEKPQGLSKKTMIIGVDVHHGGVGKKKHSIVGFAATMDDNFSKYYCRIQKQDKKDQEIIHKGIANMIVECVAQYFQCNKCLPETIVVYRDGVGDSMFQLVQTFEITQIEKGLKELQKKVGSKYSPKMAFFICTKLIKDRFFIENQGTASIGQQGRGGRGGQQKSQPGATNCESGTIVSEKVVSAGGFEFFMIAQNVTQGTCTPTRYVQLANDTSMTQETFFQLTFAQCFNYYNWPGAVKTPAVVMYAHNAAKFCGQVFKQNPEKQEPIAMAKNLNLYHL